MVCKLKIISASLLLGYLILTGCGRSKIQRVTVAYPTQWPLREYKNCAPMRINDVVTNLPFLDCDEQSTDTPRDRMFTMDVRFEGLQKVDAYWTCQRLETGISCKD
jgi:hypothetical protein